ncbi:MAG TPA: hypothetical protein VLH56_18550 [Dissulfurispiraceae bacterium]|nr:hypothetical protein [Dissulfurispiraceae bacterium]
MEIFWSATLDTPHRFLVTLTVRACDPVRVDRLYQVGLFALPCGFGQNLDGRHGEVQQLVNAVASTN